VRFNHFHPWQGVQKCQNPVRYRWGKAPRTYRGLRKIWVVEDVSRKSRTQIQPAKVVRTAIPALGLAAAPEEASDASPEAGPEPAPQKSGNCSCAVPSASGIGLAPAVFAAALVYWRRRRRVTARRRAAR
jgi:MYXO-CTERM domain-containing protein